MCSNGGLYNYALIQAGFDRELLLPGCASACVDLAAQEEGAKSAIFFFLLWDASLEAETEMDRDRMGNAMCECLSGKL